MENAASVIERMARLEAQVISIQDATLKQDYQIDKLQSDLIAGMRAQESLLREVVFELKGQHQSLKSSYDKMNSFTRGVLWLGGILAAGFVFLSKLDIKGFFS